MSAVSHKCEAGHSTSPRHRPSVYCFSQRWKGPFDCETEWISPEWVSGHSRPHQRRFLRPFRSRYRPGFGTSTPRPYTRTKRRSAWPSGSPLSLDPRCARVRTHTPVLHSDRCRVIYPVTAAMPCMPRRPIHLNHHGFPVPDVLAGHPFPTSPLMCMHVSPMRPPPCTMSHMGSSHAHTPMRA